MSSPKKSPFKKFKRDVTPDYAGYIKMSNMAKNKPYKIYAIEPTEHDEWGKGELAFIRTNKNIKWRVQLPKKYLRELKPGQMDDIKASIKANKLPYLVYRNTLEDNSYKLDIISECDEIKMLHNSWGDVPDIPDDDEQAQDD